LTTHSLSSSAAQRLKILSAFHDRCRERDPLYQPPNTSNGTSTSPVQLIDQLVEREIFQEIVSSNETSEQNEIIAMLMKKANLSMKEEPQQSQPRQSHKSVESSTQQPEPLRTIFSSSPNPTMDESELPSSSSFFSPHDHDTLTATAVPAAGGEGAGGVMEPQRKHAQVPLLPLKESIPQQENEYLSLPYGWEECPNDDQQYQDHGDGGDVCYVNTETGEVLPYDIHPSFLMANSWRRCLTEEEGEEYYFNDITGETTWVAPLEAYDDDDSSGRVCCVSSDVARESDLAVLQEIEKQAQALTRNRPPPPVPKSVRTFRRKERQEQSHKEKNSSAFPSVREKNYSIDVTEGDGDGEGCQSFESLGDLSYDALYAQTMMATPQQQQRAEEERAVYDTLSHLYSVKNPHAPPPGGGSDGAGEGEGEEGDGISALGDSFAAARPPHDSHQMVTGYSSNDGDGDTATELDFGDHPQLEEREEEPEDWSRGHEEREPRRGQGSSEEVEGEEGDDGDSSSELTETMMTNVELIGEETSNTQLPPAAGSRGVEVEDGEEEDPFASNPDSWILRKDENTGLDYYENTISGETTWEAPSSFISPAHRTAPPPVVSPAPTSAAATAAATAAPSDPRAWQMYFTDTGIPYYFNSSTGESRWTTPSDLQHTATAAATTAAAEPLVIRSNSGASYLADLTPIHSHREGSNSNSLHRYDDVYSLLDTAAAPVAGAEDENDESPYLIDLMDFMPKGAKGGATKGGRKISDLL
jgi:hypothetical protein